MWAGQYPLINNLVIKGESGTVLDLPAPAATSLMFSKNGLKDSQFWYLSNQTNSDYGYIGSKKHFDNRKVLTISLGDNGKGDEEWLLHCTLSVFQQNNPAFSVLKPDCFAEKLTLCTVNIYR